MSFIGKRRAHLKYTNLLLSLIAPLAPLGISQAHAAAEAASDEGGAVQEIVVTAQKRAENVQDVPKSVQVLRPEQLQDSGVTNLQELSRVSVAIQGTSAAPFTPPAIRGISSFAISIGVQTQTGIVLDDIPQPSFSTLANELTDVEQIEVLPGPQSTLSGRNAAGGLINIVTHNPTDRLTGNFSAEQTDDRQRRIGGYVSGPLSDKLGFSISGFYNKWDGLIRNAGENGLLLNGFNQRGVRAKLRWQPTEDLSLTLTSYYTKADFLNTALIGGNPYIYADANAGSLLGFGATMAQLYPGEAIGPFNTTTSSIDHGVSENKNRGLSLRADWDTSIGTVSSITSYSHGNQPRSDLLVAFPFFGLKIWANTDTDVKYTTQEVRLASPKSNGAVDYLGGIIYSDTRNFEPYARAILFPVDWDRTAKMQSLAFYGRATFHVTADTALTAGLRYQHDAQSYHWIFNDGTAPESRGSHSYDFVSGEVSLQHDFARDVKGYVTYANAQTGKAYDLEDNASAATPSGLQPLPSEKVQSIEAGIKSQWLDRRLTVNLSAFRSDYHNYQVQSLIVSNNINTVPTIRLYAIGKVRTQGIELQSSFAVSRALRLDFYATYLDAKIRDYPGAQCFLG